MAAYFLKKVLPKPDRRRHRISAFKELVYFSAPLTFSSLIYQVTNMSDILMLGYFALASSVGVYTVILRVVGAGSAILSSFNAIFGPIIAELCDQDKHKQLESLYKTITKWIITLSLPIYLFQIFFSNQILGLLGEEFLVGSVALIILCIGQIINAGTGSSGLMVVMSGHSVIALINNITVLILNVGLNIILIPKYGISGAALAASISMIFVNVIRVLEVYIFVKMQPYQIGDAKPLLAGLFSIAMVVFISKIMVGRAGVSVLVGKCLAFLIIYSLFLIILRLGEEDRFILSKVMQHLSKNSR
jgi:O-antigen/teichoic acid export membrane protein